MSLNTCPTFNDRISVFHSASITYHVQDDVGIYREYIRCNPTWKGVGRYDCVFVNMRPHLKGMRSLDIARLLLLFSFKYKGKIYPCALMHWYVLVQDSPDKDTGMWMVEPELSDGSPVISIIHLDCVFRTAHLIPIYGHHPIPHFILAHQSLDVFKAFYVNKFIDYHAFDFAL